MRMDGIFLIAGKAEYACARTQSSARIARKLAADMPLVN